MGKIKTFVTTAILGGLIVILPATILAIVLNWVFQAVTSMIQPFTNLVVKGFGFPEIISDLIVILLIIFMCFLVGIVVKTKLGTWFFHFIEEKILKVAPGYTLIKETILQFLGNKKPPFSSVALVQMYGNDTLFTAFITDSHDDGSYTVFVPTGPNPTSGYICHLKGKYVHEINVKVDVAMRSVIGCGSGSSKLIEAYKNR